MSSLPRVYYPGKQGWIGVVISAGRFLVWTVPFACGLALLVGLAFLFISHRSLRVFKIVPGLEAMGVALIGSVLFATFLAAFFAARSRWSHRPAFSSFVGCAVALLVWLGPALWSELWSAGPTRLRLGDFLLIGAFSLNLLTAPLGGWLGARHYHRD